MGLLRTAVKSVATKVVVAVVVVIGERVARKVIATLTEKATKPAEPVPPASESGK